MAAVDTRGWARSASRSAPPIGPARWLRRSAKSWGPDPGCSIRLLDHGLLSLRSRFKTALLYRHLRVVADARRPGLRGNSQADGRSGQDHAGIPGDRERAFGRWLRHHRLLLAQRSIHPELAAVFGTCDGAGAWKARVVPAL